MAAEIPVDGAPDRHSITELVSADQIDPVTMETIAQSIYVLPLFEKGIAFRELVAALKGETSLANAYFLFFSQME